MNMKIGFSFKFSLLLFIGVITLIAGIIIPLINFIPTWETIKAIIIVSLFFITAIIWLIFLIKIWTNNVKNRSSLRLMDWLKYIILSITMIGEFPILFWIYILSAGQGFLRATLEKEIEIQGEKLELVF